jgi:hypothetical protein
MSYKVLLKIASLLALAGAVYSMMLGNLLLAIINLIVAVIVYFSSTKY